MKNKILMVVASIVMFIGFCNEVYADKLISLENIEYVTYEGVEKVKLSFSDSIGEVDVKRFDSPDRIVVDFLNAQLEFKNRNIEVDSASLERVRSGQFMPTIVRVVLDLKKDVKYSISKDGRYYTISIPVKEDDIKQENKSANKDSNKVYREEVINKVDKQKKVVEDNKKVNKEEKIEKLNRVFIEYRKQGEYEVAKIKISDYKGYNVFRLKNPDRIGIDIPNAYFEEGSNNIKIDGNFVKNIRYNNFTKTLARVMLDVTQNPVYEVVEEKDGLKILVKGSASKKDTTPGVVKYVVAGDRVLLRINKLGFTNREGKNISNYTEKYDIKSKTYTIIFDRDIANLKDEILKIDDNYINKIEIINDKTKTRIVFYAKDNFLYEVLSRDRMNDTVILILKKATKKKSLVVIDAGHGGEEPGAMCELFSEKHLNLDIALRVEECLKKKNINTYMIRKSDVYVSLYERANIANRLNASLFVCIHNNNFNKEGARGTETLYNPNNSDESVSIKNKKFATIMQNNLIKALGTVNRGIKERPNLAVLRRTTMPGVLVEVGFLSNPDELKLLNDGSFRQKAAQAIADSIEQMLKSEKY